MIRSNAMLVCMAGVILLMTVPNRAIAQAVTSAREIRNLQDVLKAVNSDASVEASDTAKSYRILFDAYLAMTKPPQDISESFNAQTIYPGMSNWSQVSGWAESNPAMSKALLDARERIIIGLPYGEENVDSKYREAGLCVAMGIDGSLRNTEFRYLPAVHVISAYATAETYRLFEAGQVDDAIKLSIAHIFVLRQFCDRQFLAEKEVAINLLTGALSSLRDMFTTYFESISAEQFTQLAKEELPFLRPDRARLLMPEGDRIVAEALIREGFDNLGNAEPEKFADTFAKIQSEEGALTLFGASKRWSLIAMVHGSLDASLNRLTLVYDDWWRRWRVREYDPILDVPTQFERINQVRYAAVIYSMKNIEHLFSMRNQLVIGVNGTAVAAGLCAYKKTFNSWPSDIEKTYALFVLKSSNTDPYDRDYGPFKFRYFDERRPIDTPFGRVWVPQGECVLYSVGQNLEDDLIVEHTDNGTGGDLVIWPAVRTLERNENLVD